MTSLDHHTLTADPALLAAAARSVLACPSGVNLVVDGVDDVLGDLDGLDGTDGSAGGPSGLGMQDLGGVPTFSCPPGTRLVAAAGARRRALLTLHSGLGAASSPDRDAVLTLGGRLRHVGTETCECCLEQRESVTLVVDVVVLARRDAAGERHDRVRVPAELFGSAAHVLNRGYLQRSVEHANLAHQDELRRAVSTTTGTRLAEVVGVALADLTPAGVDVRWVDLDGAHARHLPFPRTAASPDDLGDLLRSQLHAGLC